MGPSDLVVWRRGRGAWPLGSDAGRPLLPDLVESLGEWREGLLPRVRQARRRHADLRSCQWRAGRLEAVFLPGAGREPLQLVTHMIAYG